MAEQPSARRGSTETSAFGVGRREAHDSSAFYARFTPPIVSDDTSIGERPVLPSPCLVGDARSMDELPDGCVALVVTSPPYFVGKEYEVEALRGARSAGEAPPHGEVPTTYFDYLELLHDVFAECARVLEPGGRIAVNVANLGRKPYRSLSADVIGILEGLGLLLRGEIIWQKGRSSSGSCAWGSFRSPANPVLRDVSERVIIASKGRFDRAHNQTERRRRGLPNLATITNDEFVDTTRDIWEIDAESARRVRHPAPFPVELPLKLIDLYTYVDDLVLDPFLGSGSTVVAATLASRRAVGYDLDPSYVALAQSRLAEVVPRPLPDGSITVDPPSDRAPAHARSQSLAMARGKKVLDVASELLAETGFTVAAAAPKLSKAGVAFDLLAAAPSGRRYYVDVAGAFTTVKPGMQRSDVWWRVLGRSHVFRAARSSGLVDPGARLLVLTPARPKPGGDGDRALRAVGSDAVFDVIELFDEAGRDRLVCYADTDPDGPGAGFWGS